MSREVVWLFGRGLSIECGLSWVEPQEWKPLPREERVRKIKTILRAGGFPSQRHGGRSTRRLETESFSTETEFLSVGRRSCGTAH